MRIFKLPDLGEGLQEAEIIEWHVAAGEEVKADQPLVSVETAKALVEIPSPWSGRIEKLFGNPGDTAHLGAPLVGFVGESGEADAGTVVGRMEVGQQLIAEAPASAPQSGAGIKATPAVRAQARKLGVDLAMVTPTGADGLITANDVQRAARILSQLGPQEVLRGVRKAMAQSMTLAHAEVAPATVMDDADIHAWSKASSVMPRLVRALIAGCRTESALNAWYDSRTVGRHVLKNIDLGIAVDTPDGLLVPVLRNIEKLAADELQLALAKIVRDGRDRKVPPEDLRGATITLSNYGSIAGRYASPVVLPPTVAILGAGRILEEVVAFHGAPAIHRVLPLSLTFDHRAVTGGEASRFLAAVIDDLQKSD